MKQQKIKTLTPAPTIPHQVLVEGAMEPEMRRNVILPIPMQNVVLEPCATVGPMDGAVMMEHTVVTKQQVTKRMRQPPIAWEAARTVLHLDLFPMHEVLGGRMRV